MGTTKNVANGIATPEMLNAIRAENSEQYKAAVPLATALNLADVGNPIVNYDVMANEFLGTLMNKIVLQLVDRQMWNNPLRIVRRGEMPLGMDVEESHINPADEEAYDGTETGMADILKMHKPDVETAYYRLNRQGKFPVTINNEQLVHAFTSWGNLENLISGIVDSLYTGATINEYKYTKELITTAAASNMLVTQTVVKPVDSASSGSFMKTLRGLSAMLTFPSADYNPYTLYKPTATPRMTWTDIDRQIILVRGDVAAQIGIDVLATAFNLQYADYLAKQIIVDSFDTAGKILAVVADERAFVIMDQLRRFATFYNASSLSWQYYYHVWDLYSISPFHNMVALVTA